MAKVKKIDAPVLFLGLGGTGFDTLMAVKAAFHSRFEGERCNDGSVRRKPPRTEYLLIDTDSSMINQSNYGERLEDGEFLPIGDSFNTIKAAIGDNWYVKEWLDPNLREADINANGAGSYRQVSRLALFREYPNILTSISSKLRSISQVPPGAPAYTKIVDVVLFSGLSGGTGSGTFLDVAYIVKQIARNYNIEINTQIYLMMPDVTIEHAAPNDPPKQTLYSVNSYAALMELDYWMDSDRNGAHLTQYYTMHDSVEWSGQPFRDVYFLCAQNDQGQMIEKAYEHNIQGIAELLVHWYESSNANGQENWKAVGQQNDTNPKTPANSFSLQSHRANQDAIVSMLAHNYPTYMKYHALGAFSNAGDEHLMLVKEWSMIYSAAVTAADDPVHSAVMTGNAPIDFTKSILTLESTELGKAGAVIRKGFEKRHPSPSYENVGRVEMHGQDDASAPHGRAYDSFVKGLDNSHGDEVLRLGEEVWKLFLDKARAVGTDLHRGPQYLLSLLQEGERSLSNQTELYIPVLEGLMKRADDGKTNEHAAAKASFRRFQDAVWLKKLLFQDDSNFQDYMSKVKDLYDAAMGYAYYKALKQTMENDFKRRLQKYIGLLDRIVAEIKRQKQAYDDEMRSLTAGGMHSLFNIQAMQQSLLDQFATQTVVDGFVLAMYRNVIEMTENLMNEDASKRGYIEKINDAMDEMRENGFVAVGGMSLETKIQTFEGLAPGNAAVLQNYVQQTLCSSLMNGANTMFYTTPAVSGLPATRSARYSMVCIPVGAVNIDKGVQQYCVVQGIDAVIKTSQSSDRIFWVNDKGGLSLNYYGFLSQLRDNYFTGRERHKSYHLYMVSNPNVTNRDGRRDEMKQPWAEAIPAPLFVRAQNEAQQDVDRFSGLEAEHVDILHYAFTWPVNGTSKPTVVLTKNLLQKINGVAVTEHLVTEAVNGVPCPVNMEEAMRLEPTEANLSRLREMKQNMDAYRARIAALGDNRVVTVISLDYLSDWTQEWGNVLGTSQDLQPLNTAMNPETEERIKQAWIKTFKRAIHEALSRRLDLMAEMEDSRKCQAIVLAKLEEVDAQIDALKKRIAEVPVLDQTALDAQCKFVAQLLMYDLVNVTMMMVESKAVIGTQPPIYSINDDHGQEERTYPSFRNYPVLLQFVGWLASADRTQQGVMLLVDRKHQGIRQRIATFSDKNEETNAIVNRAKEWRTDLQDKVKARVQQQVAAERLNNRGYDLCVRMIQKIDDELESFIQLFE